MLNVSKSSPDGIRTHDLLLRRQLLYPAELQDQEKIAAKVHNKNYKKKIL